MSLTDFATTRSLLAVARRIAGLDVPAIEQQYFAGDHGFQLYGLGWEPKPKLFTSRPRRRPGELVVHVTGVRGGFDVEERRVKYWLRHLRTDEGSTFSAEVQKTGDYSLIQQAHRLALWERFAKTVPYATVGLRNGDIVKAHPVELRTHHAGPGGNDSGSCSFDCHPREDLDRATIETFRAALRLALLREHEWSGMPVVVLPHAMLTRWPRRADDPGLTITREVVIPVVETTDYASLGPSGGHSPRRGGRGPEYWPTVE